LRRAVIEFRPDASEIGGRVDAALARRAASTRGAAQQALRSGAVLVSGRRVAPGYRLRAGDVVDGEVPSGDGEPEPESIPLAVRYSDDRVLVVSKPAGLVTHPATRDQSGTLVNALLGLGEPLATRDPARPGIVHRLDKDTSGLLLVAKDDGALVLLQDALRARLVRRSYLALARGSPATATGTIDAPIGSHPTRRRLRAVVAGGKPAVTHYRVLDAAEGAALLDVALETGRTHQVRVHLSHIGHPVVGDRVYGGGGDIAARLGLNRPFLHAYRLAWPPLDDAAGLVEVSDDLPHDLESALARAGIRWTAPGERGGVGRTG
jgi:23S rRNA pseudouridine1911/1915/1917 synthase